MRFFKRLKAAWNDPEGYGQMALILMCGSIMMGVTLIVLLFSKGC